MRNGRPKFHSSFILPRLCLLPGCEHADRAAADQGEAQEIVPLQRLFQIEHGEGAKDAQRDDLLNGLQLGGRNAGVVSEPIGRYLEALLLDHFLH